MLPALQFGDEQLIMRRRVANDLRSAQPRSEQVIVVVHDGSSRRVRRRSRSTTARRCSIARSGAADVVMPATVNLRTCRGRVAPGARTATLRGFAEIEVARRRRVLWRHHATNRRRWPHDVDAKYIDVKLRGACSGFAACTKASFLECGWN